MDVAQSAIVCLGMVGAGSNNSRNSWNSEAAVCVLLQGTVLLILSKNLTGIVALWKGTGHNEPVLRRQ